VEVKRHSFLTSALEGCERSALRPGRFAPEPVTDLILGNPVSELHVSANQLVRQCPVLISDIKLYATVQLFRDTRYKYLYHMEAIHLCTHDV